MYQKYVSRVVNGETKIQDCLRKPRRCSLFSNVIMPQCRSHRPDYQLPSLPTSLGLHKFHRHCKTGITELKEIISLQQCITAYRPFAAGEIEYARPAHEASVLEQLPEQANCQADILGIGWLTKRPRRIAEILRCSWYAKQVRLHRQLIAYLLCTNFPQAKSMQFSGPQARIVAGLPSRKTCAKYARFDAFNSVQQYSVAKINHTNSSNKPGQFEHRVSVRENDCCILVQTPANFGISLSKQRRERDHTFLLDHTLLLDHMMVIAGPRWKTSFRRQGCRRVGAR